MGSLARIAKLDFLYLSGLDRSELPIKFKELEGLQELHLDNWIIIQGWIYPRLLVFWLKCSH